MKKLQKTPCVGVEFDSVQPGRTILGVGAGEASVHRRQMFRVQSARLFPVVSSGSALDGSAGAASFGSSAAAAGPTFSAFLPISQVSRSIRVTLGTCFSDCSPGLPFRRIQTGSCRRLVSGRIGGNSRLSRRSAEFNAPAAGPAPGACPCACPSPARPRR